MAGMCERDGKEWGGRVVSVGDTVKRRGPDCGCGVLLDECATVPTDWCAKLLKATAAAERGEKRSEGA
jgi:hypothetical protein